MSALDITWEKIFPKDIQTLLINHIQSGNPQYLNAHIHNVDGKTKRGKQSIRKQKIIVRILLPDKYRIMDTGIDFTDDMIANEFSRYFNYNDKERFGHKYYDLVKKHILNEATSGNYDFTSLPFIKEVKANAEKLFKHMPDGEFQNYKKFISELMQEINESNNTFHELLSPLMKLDFYTQIASLIAIASTWYCLDTSVIDFDDLTKFIIPVEKKSSTMSTNEWIKQHILDRQQEAETVFSEAKQLYENGQYIQAVERFDIITKYNFADETLLGKTYYLWTICFLEHADAFRSDDISNKPSSHRKKQQASSNLRRISPQKLLKKACDYGNPEALKLYKKKYGNSEFAKLLRPISETHGKARIILNCGVNKYVDEWMKSLPVEMQKKEIRDTMISPTTKREGFISALKSDKNCRFLLFDDNFEKNFQDLLFILDGILQTSEENDFEFITVLHWYETVIYIRVPEDEYSTLIDTALKRLGDYTIRVFIIDDNKRVAQYLLNKYPLFKPISHITATDLCKKPVNINFNIISYNCEDLTRWLIREAYWLGCFYYSELTVSINLISPDATHVEETLRFDFPGMFNASSIADCKPAVLNSNSFKCVENLSTPEVLAIIDSLDTPNTYNYYVISTGNDISNLNFSIKLRELWIRKVIHSRKLPQKAHMPLIAFYCENSDIAYLAEHLVVQNVDSGDRWFNNYNLIPFGALQDRYAWENLDGGYLEKIAQSTHLQYSDIDIKEDMDKKIGHLKDYFSRCYNRDSSMAIALSMPYRLFQTSYGENGHIMPFEDYAQLSPDSFREMADFFNQAIKSDANSDNNKKNLLKYEHSRWVFWAVSRGWQKADSSEVLTYMKAGNPKHQLYIARMHGCINSLGNLSLLSQAMLDYVKKSKSTDTDEDMDFDVEEDANLLIDAMELAGMHYNEIDSTPKALYFTSRKGKVFRFKNWDVVQQWIEKAKLDENTANAIDDILYSSKNVRKTASANEKRYADVIQHYTSTTKADDTDTDNDYAEESTTQKSRKGKIDRKCYDYYELVPKNFIGFDEKNIAQTADIITAAWFPEDIYSQELSDEKQNVY